MGWAKDSFEDELTRARILPIRSCSNPSHTRKEKKKLYYHKYDFPTEAQIKALRFITMHTGIIFEGKTKQEAKIFIKENIGHAREMLESYK